MNTVTRQCRSRSPRQHLQLILGWLFCVGVTSQTGEDDALPFGPLLIGVLSAHKGFVRPCFCAKQVLVCSILALAYFSKPPRDQFSYISVLFYIQTSNVARNSTLGCPTSCVFTELSITARTILPLCISCTVGPKECAILIFCPLKTTTFPIPPSLPPSVWRKGLRGLLELQAPQPHCSLGAFPATGTDSTGASSSSPLAATKVYICLLTNERP